MPGILYTLSHFNLSNLVTFILFVSLLRKSGLRADKSCVKSALKPGEELGESEIEPSLGDSRAHVPS